MIMARQSRQNPTLKIKKQLQQRKKSFAKNTIPPQKRTKTPRSPCLDKKIPKTDKKTLSYRY